MIRLAALLLCISCTSPALVQVTTPTPDPVTVTWCAEGHRKCAPVLGGLKPWALMECIGNRWLHLYQCDRCYCEAAPLGGWGVTCGWITSEGQPECVGCASQLECAY